MEIFNEILIDYSGYCHDRLIEEFGTYDTDQYDPIYWYQRYKHRIIDPRIREIFEADQLSIPDIHSSAYESIKRDILNGESLKKYQSKKMQELDYDDDMLSHWGIQHLHLGSAIQDDEYVERTGNLLFIYFKDDKAYVVGVFDHSSWCDIDIIETIHNNWPSELTIFKSNSRTPRLTREQYKALRSRNACANIVVSDGTEYLAPGVGVTANGAPIAAVLNSERLIHMFNAAFTSIDTEIDKILGSDPQERTSETLTIGMRICHESKAFIYKIKETGFEFKLQS